MIRRKEEIRRTRKPAPFQGRGDITVRELLEGPGELYQKGRVFAHTTVYPGSAIGRVGNLLYSQRKGKAEP